MSTTAIKRLQSLKCSCTAARDSDQTVALRLNPQFVEGLRAGLQIAIDGIDAELRLLHNTEQPNTKENA